MSAEREIGLVVTMMVVLLILGLTGAMMPLAMMETAVAANHRRSVQLLYAADAALELTVSELGRLGAWDGVLRRGATSSHWSRARRVTLLDGTVLDAGAVTGELRRLRRVAGAPLSWTFFGHTSLARLTSIEGLPGPLVVAVWLADDPGDPDRAPLIDSNGTLVVYAAAFGRASAHRSIRAVVHRQANGWVQVSSWRVVR